MKAPFPWFGGKRRVAGLVWSRLGDVATYNEPFAGSLAVLLERPTAPRIETVNDLDCYVANFWRALQQDPEGVSKHADSPVNEADLHARHRWLVEVARPNAERVMRDPDFYDVKIAGWWVWGQCLWIGSGWCQRPKWGRGHAGRKPTGIHTLNGQRSASTRSGEKPSNQRKRPHITDSRGVNGYGRAGYGVEQHRRPQLTGEQGIFTKVGADPANQRKRPKLRERGTDGVAYRRWQGGGQGGGSGVHAPTLRTQKPQLSGDHSGAQGGYLREEVKAFGLYEYLHALAKRLRYVRVCCGDWKRVLTPSVTTYIGVTGVFLDPPYAHDLRERCYSEDHDISGEVRESAIENGENPEMRIALCGYEGEHKMPASWDCVKWKAHGGYSRSERGRANRERERVWFSPHCLQPENERDLFESKFRAA